MPRPRRTKVGDAEVKDVLARCRPDTKALVVRSGDFVMPPTTIAVRNVLSKIDHPHRAQLFHHGSLHCLHAEHWRGRSCGRHPRHECAYLRRLLYHWMLAPVRSCDELVAAPCGCANPFHAILRPSADHTAPQTQRFLNALPFCDNVEREHWATLLGISRKQAFVNRSIELNQRVVRNIDKSARRMRRGAGRRVALRGAPPRC